jgi:hypothetical protein
VQDYRLVLCIVIRTDFGFCIMSTTPMEDAESQKNVEAPVMTSVAAANSVDYKGRPIDHARTGRYKAASFLLGTHQV